MRGIKLKLNQPYRVSVPLGGNRFAKVDVWFDKYIEWYQDLGPFSVQRRRMLEEGRQDEAKRCDDVLAICLN